METLLKLRKSKTNYEAEAFEWFFSEFLECVCGKRVWGLQKYQQHISTTRDRDTGNMIVTISDEAFALLLIDNYRDKWISKFEASRRGELHRPGEKIPGKYTNSKLGNTEYAGWTEEGHQQFNKYFDIVEEDRLKDREKRNEMEELFLEHMRNSDNGQKKS